VADHEEEQKSFVRRNFFREGLRDLFSPLADLLADRIKEMPDFSTLERSGVSNEPILLRPPGARPGKDFLAACIRCGRCKAACPYHAIVMVTRQDMTRSGSYSWRPAPETGTPRIVPDAEPCRRCPDFPCAAACPSGALVVPHDKVVLGCAGVDDDACLRADGEDCRRCVEACPVGEAAVLIRRNNMVFVQSAGCTGCGQCEHVCPVDPPAIRVYPLDDPRV
jgi:ferredoxin-type protein NapG